jgi:hypothetical protein
LPWLLSNHDLSNLCSGVAGITSLHRCIQPQAPTILMRDYVLIDIMSGY